MKNLSFNVWLLAVCSALGFSVTPMIMFLGSLLGAELAPSVDLATLPIAVMVVGTATGTLPLSQLLRRQGTKASYLVFIVIGIAACFGGHQALQAADFVTFCIATYFVGVANAAIQHLRFVAMESVAPEYGPTAASVVLCGGIVAAVLGPELAVAGRFFTGVDYQCSFWLAAATLLLTGLLLLLLRPTRERQQQFDEPARSLLEILRSPTFCLALVSASVGFIIITFVMTATPISMHHHHGHSLLDTKWVMQSHIAAMFLPSLISPLLFRWLGFRGMMIAGLAAYAVTISVGFVDNSVWAFWVQLVMLGIGWNFLFVAGTAMLPTAYRPAEQHKAQGFNDGLVFSLQALGSLSAGWVVSFGGWHAILLCMLLPMAILVLMLWRGHRCSAELATNS